jgi:UDP-N-acetylmuramoyl-tripeptide--D-alanyl-D-alanine ligase
MALFISDASVDGDEDRRNQHMMPAWPRLERLKARGTSARRDGRENQRAYNAGAVLHIGTVVEMNSLIKAWTSRLKREATLMQGRLLSWAVRRRRARLGHVTFVAITGSCGKTTARALTTAVLTQAGPCQPGVTLELGKLAKALRKASRVTRFCVYELQATGPESLSEPLRLISPQIGIVTTIGGDHYKSFRTLEATALEKGKLVECLPAEGVAILNADDPRVWAMAERTRARVFTYGLSDRADLRAAEVSGRWPDRLSFTASYKEATTRIETQLAGEHWVTSVLAAIACGIVCGLDLETCVAAAQSVEPSLGRYSIHLRPDEGAYVLDSWKAPLWTIPLGLNFVGRARAPRKTIFFGTISDYGGAGGARYRQVARAALEVADRVIFVGPNSGSVEKLRKGALRERLLTFQTTYQASAYLLETRTPGELVYVKGSAADHLERLMLAELDSVVCWRERCGRIKECPGCEHYRTPKPPPFGVETATALLGPPSL